MHLVWREILTKFYKMRGKILKNELAGIIHPGITNNC